MIYPRDKQQFDVVASLRSRLWHRLDAEFSRRFVRWENEPPSHATCCVLLNDGFTSLATPLTAIAMTVFRELATEWAREPLDFEADERRFASEIARAGSELTLDDLLS